MSKHIGLYYPFIEFRDDAWVKFASLYWDKIGRIVPPKYSCNDSEVVKQLRLLKKAKKLSRIASFQEDLHLIEGQTSV